MKKKRRIEITAFRRRTTISLHERRGDNFNAAPPCHSDTFQRVLVDLSSRDVSIDIDQLTQAAQASLTELEPSESTEMSSTPNLLVKKKESMIKKMGRLSRFRRGGNKR